MRNDPSEDKSQPSRPLSPLCFTGLFSFVAGSFTPSARAAERLGLEVRETGGLARGGYPTHALLKLLRPVPPTTKFRLLHDGKPVVAQFRPDWDAASDAPRRGKGGTGVLYPPARCRGTDLWSTSAGWGRRTVWGPVTIR